MRAILLLLAVPALASAQTTNTNCFVNGQWINCSTQAVPKFDFTPTDFTSGLGDMGGATRAPQQASPQDGPPPQLVAAWAHTADLIKAHRCEDAVDFALRQGGTEAAVRVKTLCQ